MIEHPGLRLHKIIDAMVSHRGCFSWVFGTCTTTAVCRVIRALANHCPPQIFVVSSNRIRDRGYHTLFEYVTSKPSFYGKIISAAPEALQVPTTINGNPCSVDCHVVATSRGQPTNSHMASPQPLVYMGFHLAMTMLTMVLCTLWWSNYWASSAFIIAMFVVAAVNGANYYFDVRPALFHMDVCVATVADNNNALSRSLLGGT